MAIVIASERRYMVFCYGECIQVLRLLGYCNRNVIAVFCKLMRETYHG